MSAAPATAPARRRQRPRPRPRAKTAPRRAQARARKAPLRVVRPRSRHRRSAPFLLLSAFLLGCLVVGIVTLQALVSQTSFRMQDLQARNRVLQQDYGERKLTVARMSAPDRIAAAARRTGFVLPDSSHIATVHVGWPQRWGPAGESSGTAPGSSAVKAFLGAQR